MRRGHGLRRANTILRVKAGGVASHALMAGMQGVGGMRVSLLHRHHRVSDGEAPSARRISALHWIASCASDGWLLHSSLRELAGGAPSGVRRRLDVLRRGVARVRSGLSVWRVLGRRRRAVLSVTAVHVGRWRAGVGRRVVWRV